VVSLFTNAIEKKLSTNEDLAALQIRVKAEAVGYFLNFSEVRNSKTAWISIAKSVGEIRNEMIPNFTPKVISINPGNDEMLTGAKLQQAIEENERNKAINRFQQALDIQNRKLTSLLLA